MRRSTHVILVVNWSRYSESLLMEFEMRGGLMRAWAVGGGVETVLSQQIPPV